MNKVIFLTLAALVLCLGCSSSDPVSAGGAAGTAAVRVAHLSPDAPAVDVWVDGAVALSGVSFPALSDYLAVPAGARTIQVTVAGTTTPVLIDATLDLMAGTSYTVAATGFASDLQALVTVDGRMGGSQAGVRFVHASPDAPAVDVAVAGGAVLFPAVPFRGASDYISVPGASYDLEVRLAGTSTVALSVPGVVLTNGTSTTIFAIGLAGDMSLAALAAADAP